MYVWYVSVFLAMSFDILLLTERQEVSRNKLESAILELDAGILTRNEVN